MNVYQEQGFNNRREYLESVAEDFGVSRDTVFAVASMLGKTEDFDGLLTMLEDYSEEL